MENHKNKSDIVKEIFLEEKYVSRVKDCEDSAIYFDPSSFTDITKVKHSLENFYQLSLLEQQGYLRHIKELLNTLEMVNISFMVEKLYDREFSILFIEQNPQLCELLVDAAIYSINTINENVSRSKSKTVLDRHVRPKIRELSTAGFEERIEVRDENISNTILIEFCKSLFKSSKVVIREKVVKLIEKLASVSSQYERDQKILIFLIEHLNQDKIIKKALALEILAVTTSYYTPNIIEHVIINHVVNIMDGDNIMLRDLAYTVFFRTISILESTTVLLNFSKIIKNLAESDNSEVLSIFIKNFIIIVKKFPLNFIMKFLLDKYHNLNNSESLSVRIDFYSSLSKVIISLLVSAKQSAHPNFNLVQEGIKIYFNLIFHTEEIASLYRKNIIRANYKDLYEIFTLYGRGLWSYLKYLIYRLEVYPDEKIVEVAKLAMVGSVFCLGNILGKHILESEGLKIINRNFLILKKNTSTSVKMKSLSYVYKLLCEVDLESRKYFADYYIVLQDDAKQWRIKAAICDQIDHLTELFHIDDVISFIVPMTVKLCKDDCAKVRKLASKNFHQLFKVIIRKSPDFLFLLIEYCKSIAEDPKFHNRISFIDIFESLILNSRESDVSELKPTLYELASDKIVGVRIRVATICLALATTIHDIEFLKQIIENLRPDKNREIMRLVLEFDMAVYNRKMTSRLNVLKKLEN